MGCGSSNTAAAEVDISNPVNLFEITQQVKQSWADIKNIDQIGAKVFAYLLHKYAELKPFYQVPDPYNTEDELLNTGEVQRAGDDLITFFNDIIQSSDSNFDTTFREKAVELNSKNIRATQVKYFGESLYHVIQNELTNKLTTDEKKSWQVFTTEVYKRMAIELAKFPRKSIV